MLYNSPHIFLLRLLNIYCFTQHLLLLINYITANLFFLRNVYYFFAVIILPNIPNFYYYFGLLLLLSNIYYFKRTRLLNLIDVILCI